MTAILLIIVCGLILGYAVWQYYMIPQTGKPQKTGNDWSLLTILLSAGLIARVICAVAYKGHNTDMSCFTGWANSVFENGVRNFYNSAGFTDYPPGYMYVLYVIGAIKHLFKIEGGGYYLLVKFPAIIADLASGFLIYKIASKKLSPSLSTIIAAMYVFNPAVLTDSALWGQIDSVYTFFVALMVWLISEKQLPASFFVFALCILIKPQAFIYTPLIIYGIIENYVYPDFKPQALLKTIGAGVLAIVFMLLLAMPFGLKEVYDQYYRALLEEYPYFTINAFNIWGAAGLNWDKLTVIGSVAGYIILALIVAASAVTFFKSKNHSRYFYTAALLAFFTFMLSTKMHERYGFPVMIFLLLAFIDAKTVHNFALYLLMAMSQFFNIAWVLFIYEQDINKYAFSPIVNAASVINLLLLAYMIYVTYKMYIKNGTETYAVKASSSKPKQKPVVKASSNASVRQNQAKAKTFHFKRTKVLAKITKIDAAIMLGIMIIYGAFALYDLGDKSAPETGITLSHNAVRMELSDALPISEMRIFVGDNQISRDNPLIVSFSEGDDASDNTTTITSGAANSWINIPPKTAKYITLSSAGSNIGINEVNIKANGELILPSNTNDASISRLFNEPSSDTPQDGVTLSSVGFDFGTETDISSMKFFLGAKELNSNDRSINVTCLDSGNNIAASYNISSGSVFYWNEQSIDTKAERVIISTTADVLYINEVSFLAHDGSILSPAAFGDGADLLSDEQQLVPERTTFRNSTYFDEIYHARTAYEFIHHMPVYEWTHPPLGKIFISLGIMLFGMCPFGWRIAGTIFGIFMIPVIYIFAKKLLSKRWLAVVTCLLFTFDFMHFAQTRIATIDVYVTFFIMLMYLFMFKYYTMSFYDTELKKTLIPLACCGVAMGFGIASKWTGMYAGAGLAIIFFYTLYRRYREYQYALKTPSGETDGIKHKHVIETFSDSTVKTLGTCIIFFILVPALIYGLSYIPYLLVPDSQGLKTIIDNQHSMLTYHGSTVLGSTHPYSSKWYEWIIMKRPIWYYSGTVSDGVKEGISSFGNPLVWWLGIPSFILLIYMAFEKKDKICVFLIIAYLAQLVPWMGVERLTFIYHYFPCVPFITLMIGYAIKLIYDEVRYKKAVKISAFVYAGLVIILFVMFYPVLSGHACSTWYAEHFLKWFNSWVLL